MYILTLMMVMYYNDIFVHCDTSMTFSYLLYYFLRFIFIMLKLFLLFICFRIDECEIG